MKLSDILQDRFRGDIRYRGAAYLEAERVAITRVTPDRLCAVVRDGTEFETQLTRDDGDLRLSCNCAGESPSEPACKHLWATILSVDEGRLLTGSPKPGYVPPFVCETDEFEPAADEDWETELVGDVYSPPETGTGGRRSTQLQPRLRDWEARLRELRHRMAEDDPRKPVAAREREIYYEIDVEQSRQTGQLVIQTSQKQRRTNGQWGKLKTLKLRPGELGEIEREEDRRILAFLSGGVPERSNWNARQMEMQSSVDRYRVPCELAERILPTMCATGRLRYLHGREKESTGLAWDDGPPWELAVRLQQDDTDGQWRLCGELHRNGETLSLNETRLLIPGGLVFTEERVARLHDFEAFDWVELANGSSPLAVPEGEAEELVDHLLDMPALPRLELPEHLKLEEIECEPVPHLTLHSPRGPRWHRERLQGNVEFDYLGTHVAASSMRWAIVQREQGRCVLRNRKAEARAWEQLQEHGFRRLLDRRRGSRDVEIAASDLGPAVRQLIAAGWQVHADGHDVRQPGELRFQVKSAIDWFELHGDVDFEGHTIPFPELLSALSRGDTTVRLEDGSLGILPDEWWQQYGLMAGLGVAEDDHLRFANNQVALLDALLSTQSSVEYDQRFQELRDKFEQFTGVEPAAEPRGFQGTLRGYQREGLGWLKFLQDFGFGGCLADDMGLGKTVQILALLQDRRQRKRKRSPSLVVVPKSLLFNWRQECERFTPRLQVLEYMGLDRGELRGDFDQYDVILTTYGTLRRDVFELKEHAFDYVVLDEAQAIKNPGSQIAKATRLLKAEHRLALSGTPIENHLGDLWSIFEFLNPGMLGRSSAFKLYASDSDDDEARELLSRGLRPFILRRTKRQVASELPEKFEYTLYCDMGKEQRRHYEEMRDHYRASLLGIIEEQGLAKSKMHVLEALLRLRQAACHPGLLDENRGDESSAKLDVLCPHLEELIDEGHKSLVFSQFTSMLSIVRRHLEDRGVTYEYLDGQTRDRQQRVERFQSDADCGVFLISLKAGGLGLNLTAADYVFLLDPWWNPAVETQAIDRTHRVGQTRHVFAYRLICRDTVEEKIAELQNKKRDLAEAILESDSGPLKNLTVDDLQQLLS